MQQFAATAASEIEMKQNSKEDVMHVSESLSGLIFRVFLEILEWRSRPFAFE